MYALIAFKEMGCIIFALILMIEQLATSVLSCSGRNTEEASFDGSDAFKLERAVLFNILADCRGVGPTPSR